MRAAPMAVVPALALMGCGARGFYKEGATREDFDSDLRQCDFDSSRAFNACIPHSRHCEAHRARNTCMILKGWAINCDPGRFMP